MHSPHVYRARGRVFICAHVCVSLKECQPPPLQPERREGGGRARGGGGKEKGREVGEGAGEGEKEGRREQGKEGGRETDMYSTNSNQKHESSTKAIVH